jgi:hypothetical protein
MFACDRLTQANANVIFRCPRAASAIRNLTGQAAGTKLALAVSKVRHFLVPITVAWLFLHVSVVIGTTVLVIGTGNSPADIVCTCAHESGHETCPMHHQPAGSERCRLQSAQNELGLALLSVLGSLMLPPAATEVSVDALASSDVANYSPAPSGRTILPEAPPPRR